VSTALPTASDLVEALTASGEFELREDNAAGYPMRIYRNAPRALRDVFEATEAYRERTFTVYGAEALSYGQVHGKVASLAHFLAEKGVSKGDRVAIGMRNYPEWIIGFWACQAIGAVVVALNAWWTTAELAVALEDSAPAALLLDGERLDRVRSLLSRISSPPLIVAHREDAAGEGLDFAEITKRPIDRLPEATIEEGDLATILYTSGTTGRPKGAVATQRNHITNLMNTMLSQAVARRMLGAPPDFVAPQVGVLQTLPFFHIGGITGMYMHAAMGSKMVLMYKWNPHEAVDLIERHGLTSVAGVPIVVRQLLETASAAGRSLSSLVGVSAGGAPVPPDLIRRIEAQFDTKAAPGSAYGLTETTSAVIKNSGADHVAHPNSIGRPVPTADVRLVDDAGNDVARGEIGEIWVRGPNVSPGYWRNPAATEAAFGGGWFRTGDLGYVDGEGLYYVVDRKKDVIIRGGENVYCAEVEAAILEHPRVRDATVVGLPHPEYGEEVGAVLQVDPHNQTEGLADEVVADLAGRLAKFKIPSAICITDLDLPRTVTGKVLKQDVRSQFFGERMRRDA
jgi:long-chain acyl-CoA synthetase